MTDPAALTLVPSVEEVASLLLGDASAQPPVEPKGNIVPVYVSLPADLLTPVIAYLRLSNGADHAIPSFLCESVVHGANVARWSFIGANPYKVIRTGKGLDAEGDPLKPVQEELDPYQYISLPGLPKFTGGGMGYISYDCVHYFEPKTVRPLSDPLGIPESVFMFCDSLVVFDHIYQTIRCVAHVYIPSDVSSASSVTDHTAKVQSLYAEAETKIRKMTALLLSEHTPLPPQPPIELGFEAVSNVGKEGYEGFVTALRKRIIAGDIIQAVPSQRLARKTTLHPFNVYRHLRQLNPSPYMFYVNCEDVQLVGASPETLCQIENGKVAVHAIAGTIKRGKDDEEDLVLAKQLLSSAKDRAEHVMLVDLARNDISRVCDPLTTTVESLMKVEKYSHVMHLTSRVTGALRAGKTRFDALRSIFPAGTVSGAPKIRAIELVAELEKERRGVYAGAVGHIDFAKSEMDVCIAIRTMTFKDGTAYLQAGGGIVFDSVEEEEYVETLNKLSANVKCLTVAEEHYARLQAVAAGQK
ncbi:anthranilate synthase component 1 [Tilletia horrida]|nr:anthranilate synthase component 1 [Tilletia horrida]